MRRLDQIGLGVIDIGHVAGCSAKARAGFQMFQLGPVEHNFEPLLLFLGDLWNSQDVCSLKLG